MTETNATVVVYYLCDGKACGETCPNSECRHTAKPEHALHKDGDNGFDIMVGDGVVELVERDDG